MTNRADHGSVYVPPNAKLLTAELTRIGDINRADRAILRTAIFGGTPVVLNGLAVSATGTGLGVQVAPGEGVDGAGASIYIPAAVPNTGPVLGLPTEGYAPTATLAAADATNPRIDLVCLRAVTLLTDYGQLLTYNGSAAALQVLPQTRMDYFQIVVVTGTPAASPVAPALALSTDLLLAQVAVAANATTIAAGSITDRRAFTSAVTASFGQFGDLWNDYVASGNVPATSANLTTTLPAQTAYVIGQRVAPVALAVTVGASQDTYFDLSNTGVWTAAPVANNAASPAVTASSIRMFKLVSSAAAITGVTDLRALSPMPKPKLSLTPSSASSAKLNLGQGLAPTSPSNGDVWATSAGMFGQFGGVTGQFLTGSSLAAIASVAAAKASTGLADGVAYEIVDYGVYVFSATSTYINDDRWVINVTSGGQLNCISPSADLVSDIYG
jgi:hypothetical protein